jgi:hypothetical protein
MILKPQDILILLKLTTMAGEPWSYNRIAVSLSMSPSEVHAGVKRTLKAQLAVRRGDSALPNVRNFEEFLIHGLKYSFVPDRGELTRGMPTGYAAPPLAAHFADVNEPPPVWPHPDGNVRGQAFSPLYKSAPGAAREDERLYELLVLVDAIRGGRAREKDLAYQESES